MGIVPKDKPVVISAESYAKKRIFKYSFVSPKILGILTVILLMVVGVGAGVYLTQTPRQTQTQATLQNSDISLKPSEIEVTGGSGFSIDVFGNANGNQITSAQLAIKYDPEFLELLSISPKQFLPKVLIAPNISSGSATVSLGPEGDSGISGSGILATLSFKAKKQPVPSTQISFEKDQTRINILGNSTSPLNELRSATIMINPASGSATPANGQTFDFNSDAEISSTDLSILYSAWGNPQTDTQKKADLNGDGVVNGLDYAKFLPNLKR